MLEQLSEEKLKRLLVGGTVAGTLLIFTLLCVIVFQFVTMGIKASQIKKYEAEISKIEAEIEQGQNDLEYFQTVEAKQIAAFEYGYVYPEE